MTPSLPVLDDRAKLAVLARAVFREGYTDLTGRITWRQPDHSLLATPLGIAWDALRPGDILRISKDGRVLEGGGAVTLRIPLHLELHRLREDAVVVLHNHPSWSTTWAALGVVPECYDHVSARFQVSPVVFDDAQWSGDTLLDAHRCIEAIGEAHTILLRNHGVLVVASGPELAHHHACTIEWRSRLAWRAERAGKPRPLPEALQRDIGRMFSDFLLPASFHEAIRREIRFDPRLFDNYVGPRGGVRKTDEET
jgi:ribulose-5-phosphate 4-epimerase/fuculose-1-phosphate aldolase